MCTSHLSRAKMATMPLRTYSLHRLLKHATRGLGAHAEATTRAKKLKLPGECNNAIKTLISSNCAHGRCGNCFSLRCQHACHPCSKTT